MRFIQKVKYSITLGIVVRFEKEKKTYALKRFLICLIVIKFYFTCILIFRMKFEKIVKHTLFCRYSENKNRRMLFMTSHPIRMCTVYTNDS